MHLTGGQVFRLTITPPQLIDNLTVWFIKKLPTYFPTETSNCSVHLGKFSLNMREESSTIQYRDPKISVGLSFLLISLILVFKK